ncbi:cytochrome P450 2B15-like [Paramacrobiotus metropolitanus]|uniref:cytochrome P450 2B15-like n=1 Tax=Paramacrobiotus metropolitanus TaxID=2943436 RepID=UPI00244617B4|nr:cytochrome P450 2B15-like [Paramacrobiotus metropolitanus]
MIQLLSILLQPSFLVLVVTAFCVWYYLKHRNLPPGPRGLPLLGYGPYLGPSPQDALYDLRKQYGNIFSMYLGPNLTIVLNDYKAIKAAYIDQADIFSGRADGFIRTHASAGSDGEIHGIATLEGELWKISRRFMLQTFRNLGMGKNRIQEQILEEADYMRDLFAKSTGTPFYPRPIISAIVANVICVLCYGRRFDHNDPIFREIINDNVTIADTFAQAGPMQSYPILRFLPGKFLTTWRKYKVAWNRTIGFCGKEIETHKKNLQQNEEDADYIDAFLNQQKKVSASGSEIEQKAFQHEDLLFNVRALFGAGTETTTASMSWAFLYMMHYPDVQKKIHAEMDENVGRDRLITVDDRVKLPYTEAVVREIQRLGNVAPFGVLRCNLEETTLLGYRIPKRSFILPNFLAVNMDPKLWDNPESFQPERFLDKHGKVTEPPYFMPFSIGKRACVGEALARMEIFLFFANILQKFRLEAPKDYKLPGINQKIVRISSEPVPFKIQVCVRD